MIQSITEKYRPKTVSELVFTNKTFEDKVKSWVKNKALDSHILLYGAPGLGKSSTINVLINELNITDVMIINASDKTGIDDTRKIIDYASVPPFESNFKLVVFEEFERLSPQAQDSLKYALDTYDSWCKFIFTTNNIAKVSEPILTRCQQYQFKELDMEEFINRIVNILNSENISFDGDILGTYINKFYPSLRSCLNAISQNTIDNTLKNIDNNTVIILDKFDDILHSFKNDDLLTIKKKLSEKIAFEEYEALYNHFYNHLEEITSDKTKWDNIVRIIAEYLYRNNSVAFPDINFASCLIDIKHSI